MAKKQSSVDILANMTTDRSAFLTRQEKIDLISSATKTLYDRYKRLEKSSIASPYLDKGNKPTRLLKKNLEKMTNTELDKHLYKTLLLSKNKTSSITGAKEFNTKFKEKTGVDYGSISKSRWGKIRERIEESYYSSEEIINIYGSTYKYSDVEKKFQDMEAERIASFEDIAYEELLDEEEYDY